MGDAVGGVTSDQLVEEVRAGTPAGECEDGSRSSAVVGTAHPTLSFSLRRGRGRPRLCSRCSRGGRRRCACRRRGASRRGEGDGPAGAGVGAEARRFLSSLSTSHSRAVRSWLAEASVLPSVEKAMSLTQSLWPSSVASSLPSAFQSLILRSALAGGERAVLGPGDRPDRVAVAFELGFLGGHLGFPVPELGELVGRASGERGTVRREGHVIYGRFVGLERLQLLAAFGFEENRRCRLPSRRRSSCRRMRG